MFYLQKNDQINNATKPTLLVLHLDQLKTFQNNKHYLKCFIRFLNKNMFYS